MSFGSGFHGGIAAGIILGGLIIGGEIIGSQIQTSGVPPYWELGPGVVGQFAGIVGEFPAIQAVTANTSRYDEAFPALIYVDDGSQKFMILSGGAASADLIVPAELVLSSTDSGGVGFGPGVASLTATEIALATSITGITINGPGNPGGIDLLGNVDDQHNNIIPSFSPFRNVSINSTAGGIVTIANPFGTGAVIPLFNSATHLLKIAGVTAASITYQAYALPGATAIGAGIAVNMFGFICNPAG